jgi:hypothetical protein
VHSSSILIAICGLLTSPVFLGMLHTNTPGLPDEMGKPPLLNDGKESQNEVQNTLIHQKVVIGLPNSFHLQITTNEHS